MNTPPSEFRVGQRVRVVPSNRHQTVHVGEIEMVVWHHKYKRYNYYLTVNGKKVSTRYLAIDLVPE